MLGIFNINNDPFKIILKQLKKEFKNKKINTDSYVGLQNSLIEIFKKERKPQLTELKMETEVNIQYLELYNFDIFVSIRYAFYALVLAIITIVISNPALQSQFKISQVNFVVGSIIFLIFILITHRTTSEKQKHELIYLKFKLQCLNAVLSEKLLENEVV